MPPWGLKPKARSPIQDVGEASYHSAFLRNTRSHKSVNVYSRRVSFRKAGSEKSGHFQRGSRSAEHLGVNGCGHRLIASGTRVQVVAGVVVRAQSTGMLGISEGSVKIYHPVKGPACANPLIDILPGCFSVSSVVIGTFIWRKRRAEDPDSMLVRAFDDLR